MNKPDERKRGPGRGQRRQRRSAKRQDTSARKQNKEQQHAHTATARKVNVNVNANVTDDIEEQLRRQRLKRQAEKKPATFTEAKITEDPPPPEKLGKFRYDKVRGAYFPADHQHSHSRRDADDDDTERKKQQEWSASNEHEISNVQNAGKNASPASFCYKASLCSTPKKRSRWIAHIGGRSMLESATFTPSGSRSRSRHMAGHSSNSDSWSFLFSSQSFFPGRAFSVSDLWRKSELPPWTRTLDICQSMSTSTTTSTSIQTSNNNNLPLLANIMDQGALIRTPTNCRRVFEQCVTTRFLKRNSTTGNIDAGFVQQQKDSSSGGSGFVRMQVDDGERMDHHHYNNAHASPYFTHIPDKANDFVGTNDGATVLFATMPGANRKVTPWMIDYRSSSTAARAISLTNFPQSEAVCVATATDDGDHKGSSPLAYFGHRTGEVTLFDCRSATCQSTLPRKICGSQHQRQRHQQQQQRDGESIRTIVNILPLTETPHYVVTRGIFDTCRLYDMRKLTSNVLSYSKDPSIVHEFTVPTCVSRRIEKKASLCSGVATNPSQTVAIAPYTRAGTHDGSQSEVCLGIWSLYTGEFIGSKDLVSSAAAAAAATSTSAPTTATNSTANSKHNRAANISCWDQGKRGPSFVELCPTITPAWAWKNQNQKPDAPILKKVPGSFGLWFKSNFVLADEDATIPLEAGSIHHVFFEGRPD